MLWLVQAAIEHSTCRSCFLNPVRKKCKQQKFRHQGDQEWKPFLWRPVSHRCLFLETLPIESSPGFAIEIVCIDQYRPDPCLHLRAALADSEGTSGSALVQSTRGESWLVDLNDLPMRAADCGLVEIHSQGHAKECRHCSHHNVDGR